ncbi:MAG: rhodanese-like domain-containing protein [Flavobacteriaceae bacterium]|nr:rhodanese-like domain-containing protein [Flavobacteriaceae bacterium]
MKIKNRILAVFIITIGFISCAQNKTDDKVSGIETVVELDAQSFYNEIQVENIQLVDVRTLGEYNSGHIKNAILIDFYNPEFYNEMNDTLDKEKPVYVYCRSGNRSGKAAKELEKLGFSKILDLDGGINSWTRRGLSLER